MMVFRLADNSQIKFINKSYLFNNPDNLLDSFKVKQNNSKRSCRDMEDETNKRCKKSGDLGKSYREITLKHPKHFTFTQNSDSEEKIEIKNLKIKKRDSLILDASQSISIKYIKLNKKSTLVIKAPKVIINNLKSFEKSQITIIADEIDIGTINLKNHTNLIIEPFTPNQDIEMRVTKLNLTESESFYLSRQST